VESGDSDGDDDDAADDDDERCRWKVADRLEKDTDQLTGSRNVLYRKKIIGEDERRAE
jgi:hypothetical protein